MQNIFELKSFTKKNVESIIGTLTNNKKEQRFTQERRF